jgi:hypothetical protein
VFIAQLIALGLSVVGPQEATHRGEDDLTRAARAAVSGGWPTLDRVCPAARTDDVDAITVQVEPLEASRLTGSNVVATPEHPVELGAFRYRGFGVVLRSDDRRFADLAIDPDRTVPRLPRGSRLVTWNLISPGISGRCRMSFSPPLAANEFYRPAEADPAPMLAGYELGSTWPFGPDRFLGLMRPRDGAARTLLVSFSPSSGQTRPEVDFPMKIESVRTIPPLHGGDWSIMLMGRQVDGSIVQFSLASRPSG